MQRFFAILVISLAGCSAGQPRASSELPWSSVPLEGMTLERAFPDGGSETLHFAKGDQLPISYCSKDGTCTAPLIVWKIESNRLKTGFAPTEGDALVEVTADKLAVRTPAGELITYAIARKSGT